MKKKLITLLAVAVMAFSLSGTAWAVSDTASSAVPTPTPDPALVYADDLEGADGTISDAQGMLDGIYDILPELNSGVLGFMAATVQLLPDWFTAAFSLSLIFSIFVIFLRFLWQ